MRGLVKKNNDHVNKPLCVAYYALSTVPISKYIYIHYFDLHNNFTQ